MKWKFFRTRKRRERTFIHNLCPLCGRRRGASSADRVGRDPCVPPRSTHCSRRGTRAPPYRVRRSHGADRVVRPYTFCAGRRTPRAFVPLRSTAGRRPLRAVYRARPVGRDPCVPPHDIHVFRRGTRAPPYNRVRRSYRADRVVRPYEGTSRTPHPIAICSSAHTAGSAPPAG